MIHHIINTSLFFVLTLNFTPKLRADSLMVYFEPAGFDTFKIETSNEWQQRNLVFSKTSDLPITAIHFKPFIDESQMETKGFNFFLEIDDLIFSEEINFSFNENATNNWQAINNNNSIVKIWESLNSPNDSGYSVRLIFRHSDLAVYPDVSFKFSLSDTGITVNQNDTLRFFLKNGMSIEEFKTLIPLKIGNQWVYEHISYIDDGDMDWINHLYNFRHTITDTITMADNNLYYIRKYERLDSGETFTQKFRYDDDGYLVLYNGGRPERKFTDFVDFRNAVFTRVIDDTTSGIPNKREKGFSDKYEKFGGVAEATIIRRKFNETSDVFGGWYDRTIFHYGIGLRFSGTGWYEDASSARSNHDTDLLAAFIDGEFYGDASLIVSVDLEELSTLPGGYNLSQNYPNPFNPVTSLEYTLLSPGEVRLIIFNLLGQEVVYLINEAQQAGKHKVVWDASNFVSGIYFYRLQAGDFVQTRKMVLLK